MGYTFLQKPSSFKFLSILEENCGADINNGTIKCKFLLTNVSKNGRWVSYTFLQKLSSCKFYSILDENCGADIINGTFKCKAFVDKCCIRTGASPGTFVTVSGTARMVPAEDLSNEYVRKTLKT